MEKGSKPDTTMKQQIDLKTLKFVPRKITKSLPELFGQAYCYVCFRFHEIKNERKNPNYEPGMEMLMCYGCGVTAHHYCYGLATPVNDVVTEQGDKIRMFVCDRCTYIGPETVTDCGICHQKVGAFKRASNEAFVHITCSLFSELYEVDHFDTMSVRACVKSDKRVPKQNKHCDHCGKSANLFKCSITDCDSYVHIYCAFLNKIGSLIENEESAEGWAIRLFKENKEGFIPKINFDPNDTRLKDSLRRMYERVVEATRKTTPMEEEVQPVEDLTSSQKRKNSKKSETIKKPKPKAVILNEEDEQLLKELYDKFQTESSALVKKIPPSSNSRGGSSKFECQTHRAHELYCLCNQPYDQARFMLGCDSCDNWFHCTCLELSEEEAAKIEPYFCKKCVQWSSLKQSVLLSDSGSMEVEANCATIDKIGAIPKDTSRFMIIDFLIACILLERQTTRKITETGDFASTFELMIDSIKYLPFNLNGFVINTLRRHYFAEMLDKFIDKSGAMDKIYEIKSIYDPTTQQISKEEFTKINETYKYFLGLYNIYKDNVLPKTPLYEKISQFVETAQWIILFNESVAGSSARPSFPVLQHLSKESDRLNLDPNMPEVIHLKGLEAKAATWSNIVEKVSSDKPEKLQGKGSELENLSLSHLPLSKALETLDQAVRKAKANLKTKPTMNELKDLIDKGGEIGVELVEDVGTLKNKYQKAQEVQKRVIEKVKSFEELVQNLRVVEAMTVWTDEMLEVFDAYQKAKVIQVKMRAYTRQVLTVETKKKKTDEKKMEEEDEKDEDLLTIEDLRGLVQESEALGIDLEDDERVIKGLIGSIEEYKTKVKEAVEGVVDVADLKTLIKEGGQYRIKLPEVEEVKQKNELYNDIKSLQSKSCSIEQLAQMIAKLQKNFKDPKLLSSLETKLSKACELENRALRLLSQSTFSRTDIDVTAQAILSDSKSIKIELTQKNELAALQKSYKWLEKLYGFYQKNIPTALQAQAEEGSGEMEIEHMKMKDPENVDDSKGKNTSKESIEAMIKVCFTSDENVVQDIQKNFAGYKSIIKEGQDVIHSDERIKKISAIHGTIFWSIEALSMLEKTNIKGEELNSLGEMAQQFQINPSNETYLRFLPLYETYKTWMDEYNAVMNSEEFNKFSSEQSAENLKNRIQKLIDEYGSLQIQLEDEQINLKNAIARIEWSKKAQQVTESIQQGQKVPFESLQELVSYGNLIKVPQEGGLYKEIKDLFQDQKKLKDLYNEFYQAKVQAREKINDICTNPDQKNKKLGEISKIKPQLSQAIELEKSINSSSLQIPKEQIEELQNEIKKSEGWIQEAKKFLEKYPIAEDTDITPELKNDMTRDLNAIRTDMTSLVLQDENMEQSLHRFEWTFHANLVVNQKNPKPNGIEVWKKLVKLAQKDKGSELVETGLYKTIQEQIGIYTGLSQKVADLKGQESYLQGASKNPKVDFPSIRKGLKDEEAVKKIMQDVEQCKIDMTEEKKYLEELLSKGKKALEAFNKLTHNEDKVPFDSVKSTLDQFHKLSVKYAEAEKVLEGYLDKAKHLQGLLHDWRNQQKNANLDVKIAETIHNQYKDCPVYLTEVAKISKGYREAIDIIHKVEDMLKNNPDVSFDELITLSRDFDELKLNLGSRAESAKRKLWASKIEKMKAFREKKAVLANPISFVLLKNCLLEGYELLTSLDAIRELKEDIGFIEGLVKEVETHLGDLYNIRDPNLLEDISYTMHDFIDLREEIIDYKAQLSTSNDYKAVIEPSVRDLAKKEDQEVLKFIKNKEHLHKEEPPHKVRDLNALKKEREREKEKEKEREKEKDDPTQGQGKRKVGVKQSNDFVYDIDFFEEGGVGKKVKPDPLELKKTTSQQNQGSQAQGQAKTPVAKKEKVEDEHRAEAKRRLTSALKANQNFSKITAGFGNVVKLLEMNLFSDFHDDKVRYNKKVQSVVELFVQLKDFAQVSKRVLDKNFDFSVIQRLMNSNLEEIEKSGFETQKKPAPITPTTKAVTPTSQKDTKDVFKDFGVKEPLQKPTGVFESSLSLLLSGNKPEPAQGEFSKIKSMISQPKPVKEPVVVEQTVQKPKPYLEELSDEEAQKKVSKRRESANVEDDVGGGYFSDGAEDEQNGEKKEKMEEVTPTKPALDYTVGISDSGKKRELILYDPETKEEGEGAAYDPLKEYNPMAPIANVLPKYEKGSILRIFKGKMKHNMINKEVFNSVRGCSFYTCEPCEDVRAFPKLPDDIKISGRVSQNEALDYIQKLYSKQMKDPTKKQLLVGWVQAKKEHFDSLQTLSQELLDREKVAVAKYSEYAAIYFLHHAIIKREIAKNLDWKVKSPEGQPPPKATLLYVVYMRGSYMPGMFPNVIEPEFIGMPQHQEEPEHKSPAKMEVEEQKGAMSPITDEEEEAEEAQIAGEKFNDLMDMIEADPDLQNIQTAQPVQTTETPIATVTSPAQQSAPSLIQQGETPATPVSPVTPVTPVTPGSVLQTETTPGQAHSDNGAMQVEQEEKSKVQVDLDEEYNSIVEKLQKMSKEELFEFVGTASEEEKEKIISILNTVVEDDSKSEEGKNNKDMHDPNHPESGQMGQFPSHQQRQMSPGGMPMQIPGQYPQQMGMQGMHPQMQMPMHMQGMPMQGQMGQFGRGPQMGGQQQFYQQRQFQQGMPVQGGFMNPYGGQQGGNMGMAFQGNKNMAGMNPQGGFPGYNRPAGMNAQFNQGEQAGKAGGMGYQGAAGYGGYDTYGGASKGKYSGPSGHGGQGSEHGSHRGHERHESRHDRHDRHDNRHDSRHERHDRHDRHENRHEGRHERHDRHSSHSGNSGHHSSHKGGYERYTSGPNQGKRDGH